MKKTKLGVKKITLKNLDERELQAVNGGGAATKAAEFTCSGHPTCITKRLGMQ